ncbi:hypothetical protein K0017_07745 [Staphylococcus massiliensis]|uniref:lactococcin 972 family bacteriocin n=1 Tax=Staphylococcus massiliensis TaxID=555791 RepID=UPI001EDFC6F6|nr:lactococcin 972 family bacteriocin [Staphylococcus massiliensis]MCG3402205.1 hypothetical protein [Staphylococcus massiliensis]
MKKQFILASVVTLGVTSLGLMGHANADSSKLNGGSENVNHYHGLKSSNTYDDKASIQSIQQGKKSGGYWVRGTTSKNVKSKYKHYIHKGHASVINGKGDTRSGGWKAIGVWSSAVLKKTKHGNKAFYDHT